ncbi:heterokaryon incompatibility protein-domain-containing protein [Bisporella sp. PMI_857]|nr:heterokaryon incompatibility protein-domain-containing protein [Bisporella sp. PMI_857]
MQIEGPNVGSPVDNASSNLSDTEVPVLLSWNLNSRYTAPVAVSRSSSPGTAQHGRFCGQPDSAGTYQGSFTWFEAGVSTLAGRDHIPNKLIQCNVTASFEFKEHIVTWDICTADEASLQWMRRIRARDTIQLLPRAQFPAWVNFIESAHIEIYCKVVQSASSLGGDSRSLAILGHGDAQTFRAIQNDYLYYGKLDRESQDIRLLILQPGSWEDPVCCELIQSSLKGSPPKFEALSYCWGDMTDSRSINLIHKRAEAFSRVKGPDRTQAFTITSNLYDALKHLRYEKQSRTLWVDLICINQSDLQERGNQVDMMGEIYAFAELAHVWLGNSDDSSQRAMALVRGVSGNEFPWQAQYGGKVFGEVYFRVAEDLSRLYSFPWFGRVWVVQEVWKSQKAIVSCGRDSVPWECVIQANAWMMEPHGGGFPGFRLYTLPSIWTQLAAIRNTRVDQGSSDFARGSAGEVPFLELLELILEAISLNATDARDKVYALLGMCKEMQTGGSNTLALRSDYTKTASNVFADFTRWWVMEHKSLTILSAVHASSPRAWQERGCIASSASRSVLPPPNHPTWAIWHEGDGKWAKRTLGMSGKYKASGNRLAELDPSGVAGPQLKLAGLQIGLVSSIHPYPFYSIESGELQEAYKWLFDPAGVAGTWNYGPTMQDLEKAEDTRHKEKVLCVDHFISHWGKEPDINNRDNNWLQETETASWIESSFPCHGECFFKSSDGSFGLCPPMTKPGDVIVILFGASVPFILRGRGNLSRQPNTHIEYELIGECYVEKYMHGALVEKQESDNIPTQQFIVS